MPNWPFVILGIALISSSVVAAAQSKPEEEWRVTIIASDDRPQRHGDFYWWKDLTREHPEKLRVASEDSRYLNRDNLGRQLSKELLQGTITIHPQDEGLVEIEIDLHRIHEPLKAGASIRDGFSDSPVSTDDAITRTLLIAPGETRGELSLGRSEPPNQDTPEAELFKLTIVVDRLT